MKHEKQRSQPAPGNAADRFAGKRTGITRTKCRDRMQPVKKTLAAHEELKKDN